MSKNKVSTNRKTRFSWSRSKVDIIKLDHYFFNKNSALFLPVKLPDSDKADKSAAAAMDILGIKSLAVAFTHCEADGRLRVVIAGHADSTDDGGVADRFALSGLRAKSVYYLLSGDRKNWAKTVYEKHTIEDYQLVLRYFHLNKGVYFGKIKDQVKPLDPGEVNNSWNDATDKATRELIVGFNNYAKARKVDSLKLSVMMKTIKDDDAKRWPVELWEAVFILYENAIARTLNLLKKSELESKRKDILKFCDDKKPFVSCGESFPLKDLDDQKKSNYDPKPGRGAEIIFFNKKSLPGKKISKKMRIVCPADTGSVHPAKKCPIFYKHHMKSTYIDHRNLDLVIYHLKFVYYDRVKNEIAPVPAGLAIEAGRWDDTANAKVAIDSATDFNDGVYSVKVPDDATRKDIAFWFKAVDTVDPTKRWWVYTDSADADPKLVLKTDAEVKALAAAEKIKYYDLPREWSSINYWTRFEKYTVGDEYKKMMKKKGFKPFGSKQQTAGKPLIFSLDDIVLTDTAGLQNVRDKDGTGAAVALSKHSRVTLLYPDAGDDFNIKIHKPIAKEPYFSDVKGGFEANLIHDYWDDKDENLHRPCRVVVFCSEFYDIYNRRTESYPTFRFNKGNILGARAARRDDSHCSGKKSINGWDAGDKASAYAAKDAGNYRLHYLHDWGIHDNKLHSGLIIYWSCRYTVDAGQGGKKIDKKNYIEKGMKNAMDRIGLKKYQLEKLTGTEDIVIKTFPLLEAKQDYKVGSNEIKRGGEHICLVSLTDDTHTSGMGYDMANFRSSAYQDEPARASANPAFNNTQDYDGHTYNSLTGAHEMGHALGLDDEYIRTASSGVGLAQYDQYYPGVPYSGDMLTLMNKNRGTRMHHFWLYANWINDASENGQVLHDLLKGTKFKLVLKGGPGDLSFELTHDDYRNVYKPVYEDDVDYGGGTHGYLIVYKLGDGEFANTLKANQKFTGIMVVRTNICVKFTNDTSNWTAQEAYDWVQALDSDLKLMLGNKYWLKRDDPDHPFKKVYLYFLPHYSVADPAPAGTHYKLEVKRNDNNGFNPDGADKSKIVVDDDVENKKIIRHFFGKFAGHANLTKPELAKIKDWIGHAARANVAFTIEDL